MSTESMNRWRELIARVIQTHGDDGFFKTFNESIESIPQKRAYYLIYEKAFL